VLGQFRSGPELSARAGSGIIGRVFDPLHNTISQWGIWAPLLYLCLFLDASGLMIWRQEAMTHKGMEGTALGTLIMPYCSGLGNILFVVVMLQHPGAGTKVVENCLVNNVTNLTLLIGLPSVLWGMAVIPAGRIPKKEVKEKQLNRLSLLTTLAAVFFFTGAVWALSRDGWLGRGDGIALVGLFAFWQALQVFDVMKSNVQKSQTLPPSIWLDLLLIILGGFVSYFSIEGLVDWLLRSERRFLNAGNLGWLTGWLMVVPNALMAFYYGWRRRSDIVYSSQVGDGHICIPLCVGLFAIFQAIPDSPFMRSGLLLLVGVTAAHFALVATLGRLPRAAGALLTLAYLYFVYAGMIGA